jgi:ABC-type antimicrobial peptide transport system permease subunit
VVARRISEVLRQERPLRVEARAAQIAGLYATLVLSPAAAGVWLIVGAAVTFAATLVPARKASALVIREALGRT